MAEIARDRAWTQIADHLYPGATVRRVWSLGGGVSSQMTALEIALADGGVVKLVVRRPGDHTLARNPHALTHEAAVLRAAIAAGVPAPAPLWVDESGALLPGPLMVQPYVEGVSLYAAEVGARAVVLMATHLARLHRAAVDVAALEFLPSTASILTPWHDGLDESLQEGRIRAALDRAGLPPPVAPCLLHGDFWPGNLLWQGENLVAVVDWEDAMLGDPLVDLAISRLDVLWIYGADAMHALTATYRGLAPVDAAALARYDLVAALRPCGNLPAWAAGWPRLGRPDITLATMTAAHAWFVEQALAVLQHPN